MVLHRRNEAEAFGELASVMAAAARSEALDSLEELNAQCLELLSEQALTQPAQANLFLHHVGEMWRSLDEQGRRRAALSQGIDSAVAQLGAHDGFLNDPKSTHSVATGARESRPRSASGWDGRGR